MPCACGIIGSQTICHDTALVGKRSLWTTPCPVWAVATPWCDIMSFGIFTASVLQEVCKDVALEPPLKPLSGEQLRRSANATQETRLDISARGFWGDRFSRSLFDVRVFHPNAPSAIQAPLASQYAKHERSKRREYEQRVCDVEGAGFVPLVFSSTGGMGPASATTFKRLADLLSEKLDCPYAAMLNWLRCRVLFALLRSAVTSLRGSRRHLHLPQIQPLLALTESRLSKSRWSHAYDYSVQQVFFPIAKYFFVLGLTDHWIYQTVLPRWHSDFGVFRSLFSLFSILFPFLLIPMSNIRILVYSSSRLSVFVFFFLYSVLK